MDYYNLPFSIKKATLSEKSLSIWKCRTSPFPKTFEKISVDLASSVPNPFKPILSYFLEILKKLSQKKN